MIETGQEFHGQYNKSVTYRKQHGIIKIPEDFELDYYDSLFMHVQCSKYNMLYYRATSTRNTRSNYVPLKDNHLYVPRSVLENLGIGKRVLLAGCRDTFELWHPVAFEIAEKKYNRRYKRDMKKALY